MSLGVNHTPPLEPCECTAVSHASALHTRLRVPAAENAKDTYGVEGLNVSLISADIKNAGEIPINPSPRLSRRIWLHR